jgi:hypothetical protein
MQKKTIIQIFLLLFLILLSYLTFNIFYESQNYKNQSKNNEKVDSDKSGLEESDKNLIKNIKYKSNNTRGDIYEILADYGEVSLEDPDLMYLTNVTSNILFEDKPNVLLTSSYANFNTKTFETTFIDNVKILRSDEIITGDELYLVLDSENDIIKEKNLLRMSHNVVFKKPGYNLKADIFEIDLITKNSKVYMNKNLKKVTATSTIK